MPLVWLFSRSSSASCRRNLYSRLAAATAEVGTTQRQAQNTTYLLSLSPRRGRVEDNACNTSINSNNRERRKTQEDRTGASLSGRLPRDTERGRASKQKTNIVKMPPTPPRCSLFSQKAKTQAPATVYHSPKTCLAPPSGVPVRGCRHILRETPRGFRERGPLQAVTAGSSLQPPLPC